MWVDVALWSVIVLGLALALWLGLRPTGPRERTQSEPSRRRNDSRRLPHADQQSEPPRRNDSRRPPRADQQSEPPRRNDSRRLPRADQQSEPPRRNDSRRPPRAKQQSEPPRRNDSRRPPRADQQSEPPRRRNDSRRIPRAVELGDDLEITVIKAAPSVAEIAEVEAADVAELRPSRVQLIYEDEATVDEPTEPAARILMAARGDSDRGRFRENNEDRLLLAAERSVFVVADGMGGHAGGEVASELAVRTVGEAYARRQFQGSVESERPIPRRGRELSQAIQMANQAIFEHAAATPALRDMGTTLVAAKFSPRKQRVYIGHVGDSRCYRIRQGRIRQLTSDHNLAAVGVSGPHAGRLARALGIAPSVTIDLIVDQPLPNDVYCLCTDGLSKMLSDEDICRVVQRERDLEAAVYSLIELANDRGGRDNITVVLVRIAESAMGRHGLTLSQAKAP
jgi:serine/threonine protein phosphatase PrpC